MEIATAFGESGDVGTWGRCLRVIVFKCLGSFSSNTQTLKHLNTHLCIVVLLWLLLALVVTGTVAAATVEGRVVDENDQPLAGANVQLFDERSGVQRYGTATRADGTFRLETVRPLQHPSSFCIFCYRLFFAKVKARRLGVSRGIRREAEITPFEPDPAHTGVGKPSKGNALVATGRRLTHQETALNDR